MNILTSIGLVLAFRLVLGMTLRGFHQGKIKSITQWDYEEWMDTIAHAFVRTIWTVALVLVLWLLL